MKKALLTALVLIVLLAVIGLLLPRVKKKNSTITVKCPSTAVARHMISMNNWGSWWPGNRIADSSWQAGEKTFKITSVFLNGFQAISADQQMAINLQFLPNNNKETSFSLQTTTALPFNPFFRLWAWFSEGNEYNSSNRVLSACSDYFGAPRKVYGIDIIKGKVNHFSWISTKESVDHYPSTIEIYRLIDALKDYILQNKAEAVGEPILHVYQNTAASFEVMVAIPTNRDLPAQGRFQLKNMILGSLLTATVKGGVGAVNKAASALEDYARDYQLVSPAIPFQTLITDRRKESDSTRWESQVNYPIFSE